MKEMRLFEVGFKSTPRSTSYEEKFYVAAEGGEQAIEIARRWLLQSFFEYYEEDGKMYDMLTILGDEVGETFPDDKEIPDGWLENRFASSAPLRAALQKRQDDEIARLEGLELARVYDEGTVIV